MSVKLPDQLTEVRIGKVDTLFDSKFFPFIWVVSVPQRLFAFHAVFYTFEGKLPAITAHLLIVEVLVVVLVELLFID